MAMTMRLGDGWTLTDGVLDPFLLPRPMEVRQALRVQGVLPHQVGGSELTKYEWTRLRSFTYACKFDAPEEDDELYSIHFPLLAGSGWIKLNGHICWRFEGAGVWFPITGNMNLKPQGNLLEVVVEPDAKGGPLGIVGDVFLRAGNYLMLQSARFDGRGGKITAKIRASAFTSGKYLFKYTASLDGRAAANEEYIERMRALDEDAQFIHELNIPGATLWDPTNPDETSYTVKLAIERMGVGCEQAVAQVAMLPEGFSPTRIAKIHPAQLAPGDVRERVLTAVRELGAEAVLIGGGPTERGRAQIYINWSDEPMPPQQPLLPENLLPYGLLTVDHADEAESLPVQLALAPLDTLQQLGGDWGFWPTDRPMYRWFGCAPIDVGEYEARFGVNAAGDAGRCARLSRMLQAEGLYRAACEARLRGAQMLLNQPIELEPSPQNAALIGADGAQRPACQAIEAAWSAQCAYAELPESMAAVCGSELSIPLRLITDVPGRALSVTVTVFGQDERHRLAQQTFEGSASGELGKLSLTMPGETAALTVRCEIQSGGALLWRHDSALCAHREGEPPMAAMMKL